MLLTMMASGVFLMMSLLLGRPGPNVHCSVLAVSTANLLMPGVASATGTATSCRKQQKKDAVDRLDQAVTVAVSATGKLYIVPAVCAVLVRGPGSRCRHITE
jgi:hypothetical protein